MAEPTIENYKEQAIRYNKWIDELQSHLYEVAASGVSFEDERVSYVEVQIDRKFWEYLQSIKPRLRPWM